MRSSEIVKQIRIARAAKRPVMLWGPPGIGKSDIVRQCAELDGCGLLDWRLAQMDAVDLRGIPSVKDGLTRWNPPFELPRDPKKPFYIFVDEILQAMMSTTNGATQLILDRKLGEYEMHDNVYLLAAGNREEDMATANRMPTHVANRFIHLNLDVHVGDWLEWAEKKALDPSVLAFIKYRPELLHVFDPRSKEKAFAAPRSWEFMSQIKQQVEKLDPKGKWQTEERAELACGIVGEKAGVEYISFLRVMEKLVSIDEIIASPLKAKVPTDASISYAIAYALAEHATRANLKSICIYIDRLPKELSFLFFRRVEVVHADLKKTKEFITWATKNQHLA